mgnify:CR=1 FL=1
MTFENNPTVRIETTSFEPLAGYIATAEIKTKKRRAVVQQSHDEMNSQYEIVSFDPVAAKLTARRKPR